jgi:hypothetical protein
MSPAVPHTQEASGGERGRGRKMDQFVLHCQRPLCPSPWWMFPCWETPAPIVDFEPRFWPVSQSCLMPCSRTLTSEWF